MAASRSSQETPQSGSSGKLMCFTHEEVITLIEAFNKKKHIILKSGSHFQNYAEKRDAWLEISKTVNSKNPSRQRTVLQLKEKWKGLLKIARRDYEVVKQAAQRMEPAPDIGKYSEMIWDIYGNKIQPRVRRRSSRYSKVPAPPLRYPNSPGRALPMVEDEDSRFSVSGYYYDEASYSGDVGGAEFDHSSYISHNKRRRDEAGEYYEDEDDDNYDTDAFMPNQSSPQRNQQSSEMLCRDRSEDEGMEEGEAMDNEGNELMYHPKTRSKRRYPASEVMYFDETDIESMRRSLMKAKMSMIALQKSKIESELEKLDFEKEKLKIEKHKAEMEMLLLQKQMNIDNTEDNPLT